MKTLRYGWTSLWLVLLIGYGVAGASGTYVVVDTGQTKCYSEAQEIPGPAEGARFYGQDAQYAGTPASYRDNGNAP
ncbi:MAG TPA: hypothetical protein QGH10_11200 [Armatimonadota bacterium]|nr:hypothetical protein [Armatimonadota bacterium]